MPRENRVLFVQERSRRAGAQVSLSRLVTQSSLRELRPHVLLGSTGWLSQYLDEASVPNSIAPWPSPRSLKARLGGIDRFARQTVNTLKAGGITPRAIIANDHQECLPALALARAAGGVPVIAILRTPGMTRRDFEKYQCAECDHLFARGHDLSERANQWSDAGISCMLGSVSEEDRLVAPEVSPSFPTRVLVVGSEEPRKGFQDFLEALRIAETTESGFPALEVVFTCEKAGDPELLTRSGFRSRFEFAGRVEGFRDFAKDFQFAIHPSRAETFGMAPFELILAGVPTMLSCTGEASSLPVEEPWIFPPESPRTLAEHLIRLWKNWSDTRPDMPMLQNRILEAYPVSASANALAAKVTELA